MQILIPPSTLRKARTFQIGVDEFHPWVDFTFATSESILIHSIISSHSTDINPTNLSSAWPWMSNVKDVASFDTQANLYFSDPTRFHATKFNDQLQCNRTAAQNTTLQWQKTILWVSTSRRGDSRLEVGIDFGDKGREVGAPWRSIFPG